jgi:hypothetical protein
MKAIYYILILSILGLASCGEMDNLSSFSKRKYLKKAPKQKAVKEKKTIEYKYKEEQELYAGSELAPEAYLVQEKVLDGNYQEYIEIKSHNFLINTDTVILNNGEVYAGKITDVSNGTVVIKVFKNDNSIDYKMIDMKTIKYTNRDLKLLSQSLYNDEYEKTTIKQQREKGIKVKNKKQMRTNGKVRWLIALSILIGFFAVGASTVTAVSFFSMSLFWIIIPTIIQMSNGMSFWKTVAAYLIYLALFIALLAGLVFGILAFGRGVQFGYWTTALIGTALGIGLVALFRWLGYMFFEKD